MTRNERNQLLAERSTLTRLFGQTPEVNVIDRMSLQSRLRQVEQRIAALPADEREPARVRLTFRGRPVVGSHGVFAQFGMDATKAFTDAVAMLAAGISRPLADVGPIPGRDQNQLLITRTALGSFGFELEEHRDTQLRLDDESALALALEQAQELLEGAAGSDDELTDAAAGVDQRVLGAFKNFLDTLATNEAVCAVEYRERKFSFRDVSQVRRSANRLVQENVHEQEAQFAGEFQGVLPKRRTFEFKLADDDTVISGKIGPDVHDPDELNQHLHQSVKATFAATRLGTGRPRYVLKQLPSWDQGVAE